MKAFATIGLAIGLGLLPLLSAESSPLVPHPENSRYFADASGKAIYLAGSHVWSNLRDGGPSDPPDAFDYGEYLYFLEDRGHNLIRLWAWDIPTFHLNGAIYYATGFPWPRTGASMARDGKPRFDLSRFDEDYFQRLRQRIILASERGIYVSVMLFEGFGLQFYRWEHDGFPFDGANNVNDIDAPGTSSHTLANPAVTRIQENYVKKVIDTINDLDNVLYEVANESGSYSTEWQNHMISVIRGYQATKPKSHPVGMTFQYQGGSNTTLFDSDADWISPNEDGGYKDNPPPASGDKVIIADSDHLWGEGGDGTWVWKNFTRGIHTLFMDGGIITFPATSDWRESARAAMGHVIRYAERMDLANSVPEHSTAVCSTGFCLVNPGKEYLGFQPDSGLFVMAVSPGTYTYEWFRPATGQVHTAGQIIIDNLPHSFAPPFTGAAVIYLKNTAKTPSPPAPPSNVRVE